MGHDLPGVWNAPMTAADIAAICLDVFMLGKWWGPRSFGCIAEHLPLLFEMHTTRSFSVPWGFLQHFVGQPGTLPDLCMQDLYDTHQADLPFTCFLLLLFPGHTACKTRASCVPLLLRASLLFCLRGLYTQFLAHQGLLYFTCLLIILFAGPV